MLQPLLQKLDEIRASLQLIRPLNHHQLQLVRSYFSVGLTYSSNALEGNTLTESETKVVIEDGLTVGGKPLREHLEASGHADAFCEVLALVKSSDIKEHDILALHKLFYQKIDPDEGGRFRKKEVIISGSRYPLPKPSAVATEVANLIARLPTIRTTHHPVIAAALFHKEFVFIHPFIDGNGRVARLLMNLLLLQEGYLPVIIPPVRRLDYISALEEAHKDDSRFVMLITEMALDTARDFARMLNPM